MNATTKRARRQPRPVAGTMALLRPIGSVTPATGEVRINGRDYYLTRLDGGFRLHGYDPRKQEVTVYDLPADLSGCDCPDAVWCPDREGGCKHRKALLALQAAGRLSQ